MPLLTTEWSRQHGYINHINSTTAVAANTTELHSSYTAHVTALVYLSSIRWGLSVLDVLIIVLISIAGHFLKFMIQSIKCQKIKNMSFLSISSPRKHFIISLLSHQQSETQRYFFSVTKHIEKQKILPLKKMRLVNIWQFCCKIK